LQLPNQAIRYFSSRAKKAVAFLNELPPLPTNVQAGCARSLPVVSIAALGLIERLYVLSPDRLSRKYAHQVLLIEELSAFGVEVVIPQSRHRRDPGRGAVAADAGHDR